MKTAIILGSSRSDGNTRKMVQYIQDHSNVQLFDLNDYTIGHFDYDNKNKADDFIPLCKEIIENHDLLLFATPEYWYSMSAQLKTFFDRLSDLLKWEKPLGRQLRGKKLGLLCCSSGPEKTKGFSMPFIESAVYLGMDYFGEWHTWVDEEENLPKEVKEVLNDLIQKLK